MLQATVKIKKKRLRTTAHSNAKSLVNSLSKARDQTHNLMDTGGIVSTEPRRKLLGMVKKTLKHLYRQIMSLKSLSR